MLDTDPDTLMSIFGAMSPDSTADFVSIMRFEPTATAATVRNIPARLIEPVAANSNRAIHRRQFVLDSGICGDKRPTETGMLPGLCINGKTHDLCRIDVETKLGTLEIWEIVSIGMAHPFHVHSASFRILSLDGAPPPAHLAGWKDVVLVEDKAELLVAFNHQRRRNIPSCITAISSNTRTPGRWDNTFASEHVWSCKFPLHLRVSLPDILQSGRQSDIRVTWMRASPA